MPAYSYGTEKYINCSLIYDMWSIGDCPITYKNIEHPYIQEFFLNMGANACIYKEKYIKITGNISLRGPDLHNFLTERGVNLRENPAALDTILEEEKPIPASFTPGYKNLQDAIKVQEEQANATDDPSPSQGGYSPP